MTAQNLNGYRVKFLSYRNMPEGSRRYVQISYYFYPVKIGPYILTIGSVWSDIQYIDMTEVYPLILSDAAKAAITGTRQS